MKKHLKVLAATVLAGLTLSACGADSGSSSSDEGTTETATVKVGIVQLPIFAPIYVAEAKGYFDEAGLDVQLETVKSGQDAVPLASSGKLDVVAAGFSAGMFSAIATGLDIKVVASMGVSDGDTEKSPTDLVVSKAKVDSGDITSIADLKGKKIGAAGGAGGTGAFLLSLALEEEGLTINDVEIVNLGNPDMPTALANGSLDAGLISAPFSTLAIEDGTGVSMAVPPAGTSGTGMLYGGQFADTENAQKFFDAVARAAKDLQGEDRYSDENLKIIAEATGQTVEELKSVPLYTWMPNLEPLPEQLEGMEAVWMESGAIEYEEAIKQDTYIDSSFSEKTS
ncbi:ABC transporter substrate-binding protein [Arthrobacter sp. zg-Y238]|uniref:ABC transporter substrate-binding protein n=1 Tax=Arthrobacter sp. zg-Y238 TaxID=2964614 RepID=UPI00210828BF|nr:ABC transporter substrate-binding protein [Arthrobacter sp. zg-Y238]MCQ1954103.1 ABC transporter substrate-binding protein [Arthrobacter sp. zg-Y238]